jgi:hypothetical protein
VTQFGFENSTIYNLYVAANYFSVVTVFTIGYGDIYPTNSTERVFAIVLMLFGILNL